MRPTAIVHCDWSIDPRKRWLTEARVLPDGTSAVSEPRPVGLLDSSQRLGDQTPAGSILDGFDFPKGVPRRYAEVAGITRFPDALLSFSQGEWADFYVPAESADQISPRRPFYPRKPGGTQKQHLFDGLELSSASDLRRACDHSTAARGSACELFWTLGANQVGQQRSPAGETSSCRRSTRNKS